MVAFLAYVRTMSKPPPSMVAFVKHLHCSCDHITKPYLLFFEYWVDCGGYKFSSPPVKYFIYTRIEAILLPLRARAGFPTHPTRVAKLRATWTTIMASG